MKLLMAKSVYPLKASFPRCALRRLFSSLASLVSKRGRSYWEQDLPSGVAVSFLTLAVMSEESVVNSRPARGAPRPRSDTWTHSAPPRRPSPARIRSVGRAALEPERRLKPLPYASPPAFQPAAASSRTGRACAESPDLETLTKGPAGSGLRSAHTNHAGAARAARASPRRPTSPQQARGQPLLKKPGPRPLGACARSQGTLHDGPTSSQGPGSRPTRELAASPE